MASRASILTIFALAPLVFVACGDDGPATEDDGTGTQDGDTDAGDGDGDTGDGDGDTGDGDGDTGDGDGDTGDGDGDGDPGECDEPGDAYASFSLDVAGDGELIDWDLVCTSSGVKAADGGESGYQIPLYGCVDANDDEAPTEMFLIVDSSPATQPMVGVDEKVSLRWVQYPPFTAGKWFTLRGESDLLLLAGLEGPAVLPWDTDSFDYAPLGVELVSIGCEPYEHPSQCGLAERQAFDVTWDGETTRVSDKNSGYIGPLISYDIVVGSALDFPQLDCDDFPSKILSALFFLIPEG